MGSRSDAKGDAFAIDADRRSSKQSPARRNPTGFHADEPNKSERRRSRSDH